MRHVEPAAQLVIPADVGQMKQEGARCVTAIGGVQLAAGQAPDEEAVDGAGRQLSRFGPRPPRWVLLQEPAQLGGREIGIEDEAGALPQPRLVLLTLPTKVRRAAILPDDGPRERPAGGTLPQHDRFPLVGDANRGYGARLNLRRGQCFGNDAQDRLPDFLGVMLHPTRSRIVLRQFARGTAACLARLIVDDGPRACRALVDGQNKWCWHGVLRLGRKRFLLLGPFRLSIRDRAAVDLALAFQRLGVAA